MKQIRFFLIIWASLTCLVCSAELRDTLMRNLVNQARLSAIPNRTQIDLIRSHLNPDGSFGDISYVTTKSGAALAHPQRLNSMALCYTSPSCVYAGDATLKTQYYAALRYWVSLNLNDANWYDRYIGYPLAMWSGVVLMDSMAQTDQKSLRDSTLDYLLWAWKYGKSNYKTGANLANILNTAMPAAILQMDTIDIKSQRDGLDQALVFAPKDGIHSDWSYSMHTGTGLQLYNGGYGAMFIGSAVQIQSFLGKSHLSFAPWAINQVQNLLLQGCRWMSYGKVLDYNALGRGISRTSSSTQGLSFQTAIHSLIGLQDKPSPELLKYEQESANNLPNALQGNRLFYAHDFMVQRSPNWYLSARATSTRTVGNESGNGEGLKDFHMGDGVLLHLVDGGEYTNIFPLWNWNHIPGTTSAQNGIFPLINWGAGDLGGSSFAGGVSDGLVGVLTMIQDRDSVQSHKAWFFNSQGVLALGAAITSTSNSPVQTAIEQDLSIAAPILSHGTSIHLGDHFGVPGHVALWHRQTIYNLLDSSMKIEGSLAPQTGSWASINQNAPSVPMTETVFQLWIDHGIKPKSAHYAYGINPGQEASALDHPFSMTILQNSDTIQAATDQISHKIEIVFYKGGRLRLPNGDLIQVDQACAIIVDPSQEQIFLSNPNRNAQEIKLTYTNHLDSRLISLSIPTDRDGKSERISIPHP